MRGFRRTGTKGSMCEDKTNMHFLKMQAFLYFFLEFMITKLLFNKKYINI